MDWTNELKQTEAELRKMPVPNLTSEKRLEIYNVLKKQAAKKPRARIPKAVKVGVMSAACVAVAVSGASLYHQYTNERSVRGAFDVQNPKPFTLPMTQRSENWEMTMRVTSEPPNEHDIDPGFRYDFDLVYHGPKEELNDVMIEETGLALIWRDTDTRVESDLSPVGWVERDKVQHSFTNFGVFRDATEVKFTLIWNEDGQTHTETLTFPRQ